MAQDTLAIGFIFRTFGFQKTVRVPSTRSPWGDWMLNPLPIIGEIKEKVKHSITKQSGSRAKPEDLKVIINWKSIAEYLPETHVSHYFFDTLCTFASLYCRGQNLSMNVLSREEVVTAPTEQKENRSNASLRPLAHIVWRGAALLLVLMTAYLWWTRNFGEGLAGVPVVAIGVAAFSFAFGFFGEGEQKLLKKKFFHFMLSGAFLVPIYVAVVVALCSSAAVVVLNQGAGSLDVKLKSIDNSSYNASGSVTAENPARFALWTTPFGRPFLLEVTGYAPKIIEVSAPLGITISPERDLVLPVAILVRPGPSAMRELASGGSFHLFRGEGASRQEIAQDLPDAQQSLLIAPEQMLISQEMIENWKLELQAQAELPKDQAASLILKWKTPRLVHLFPKVAELGPKQKITAEVSTKPANTGEKPKSVACGHLELPDAPGRIVDLELEKCGT